MLKLLRKWKYGDSSKKPLYVKSKDRWLYKNKWITPHLVINILTESELRYTYTIGEKYYTSMYNVYYTYWGVIWRNTWEKI